MLTSEQQIILLTLARQAIDFGFTQHNIMPVTIPQYPEALQAIRATFVTLKRDGELRGCIGTLEAHRTLVEDVIHNAWSAAFADPRFPPLTKTELQNLNLHISILNPAEAITFTSEEDLIQQLRPGVDGLILRENNRQGTFLPSVWDSLDDPAQFLRHLKLKTGLRGNYWSESIAAWRYTVNSFGEP